MLHKLSLILICISVVSCSGKHDQLNRALKFAGSNRSELEKVLEHYSQDPADSLKLRAAVFLIENMPGHYSVTGEMVGQFAKKLADGDALVTIHKHAALCLPEYYADESQIVRKEDVTCITSDFLIRHIDKVFRQWEKMPWKNEYSFETFCEYVLPYRVDAEPLEYLTGDNCTLPVDSIYAVMSETSVPIAEFYNFFKSKIIPPGYKAILPPPFDNDEEYQSCIMDAGQNVIADRVMGIPAAIDRIASYGDRSGYHQWPVVIGLQANYRISNKCPKIYRKMFSRQECPTDNGKDFIPHLFKYPFNKDVTSKYVDTEDVAVKIKNHRPKYLYLGVSDQGRWVPVAWSKVKGGKAHFEDMGTGVVYQALYYDGMEQIAVGYPFVLELDGKQRELKPQEGITQALHLVRKYPMKGIKLLWHESLRGMMIEASNDKDFKKVDTLYIAGEKDIDLRAIYGIRLRDSIRFRYLRCSPSGRQYYLPLAEITFLDQAGNKLPVELISDVLMHGIDLLIDGDPLTFSTINRNLLFDFGEPMGISAIRIMPRSDGNYIYPDESYELMYRDQDDWRSLGMKTATGYALDYENVPAGALYWLRNHTKGREERIFSVENGRIVFW